MPGITDEELATMKVLMEEVLLELDLEYRLSVADRVNHDDLVCAQYLVNRRAVLIPEFIKAAAQEEDTTPVEIFISFRKRLHTKLCEGG